jgi:hypothetical protein
MPDVSKNRSAFILKGQDVNADVLNLKMKAVQSFEMSVIIHPTTQRNTPDDLNRQSKSCRLSKVARRFGDNSMVTQTQHTPSFYVFNTGEKEQKKGGYMVPEIKPVSIAHSIFYQVSLLGSPLPPVLNTHIHLPSTLHSTAIQTASLIKYQAQLIISHTNTSAQNKSCTVHQLLGSHL